MKTKVDRTFVQYFLRKVVPSITSPQVVLPFLNEQFSIYFKCDLALSFFVTVSASSVIPTT